MAMQKYRLLGGAHEQPDRSKPLLGPKGEQTGRFQTQRFVATKTDRPVVESEMDLVATFGPQRFELVGGQAEKDAAHIAKLEAEIAALKAKYAAEAATAATTAEKPDVPPAPGVKHPGTPVTHHHHHHAVDDLEGKSIDDLKAIARADGIDLRTLNHKSAAEIVQAIKDKRAEDDNA